ncbi:MAG: bifunctional (p)ppGpp synthetase/guanosine-3',5'-bis(diphosphate) 3'-pyrophosphohydrolase [Deltaproteobacteria bacterium]|nr:bifunctional (p)ppGpp synthetase/guanosine-3',5'-bis(diphosphate) 3'-pyrophosphohydrolase [Deltaproteobacteria bacterium]
MRLQEIIVAIQSYQDAPDIESVRRAYSYVLHHHKGQTRVSGEPYVTHVTEVAFLAAKLKLDTSSIVAALLHDTVEDTDVTLEDLQKEFGEDAATLVDGVTKLSKINFSSKEEQQAENFRKMLIAMARDIRVLLVKLCDRLHNMRTLGYLSESRRRRIAQETLDIYAPLAHRLGIHWMKSELEDLSFRHLKPEIYDNIKRAVNKNKRERERYIDEVVRLISRELEQNNIAADVSGRPKHFYSIYQKMQSQELNFDDIFDLTAFRIIVNTQMECYAALGVVHAAWRPIPGRFKDYIAMPKPNNYRSLHTTVIGPRAQRIEIQIRTQEMHDIAEKGIAAHWVYKKEGSSTKASPQHWGQFPWLRDLLESGKALRDPVEFMSTVKDDLFPEEVFVFTPKGDVVGLAKDSTPIDFAYHIHSEVGNHCAGARVNGQQVALSHRLQNGDTVEIITSSRQIPNKDWLNVVATSKAKQRIRAWRRTEERECSIAVGKELLSKDLAKLKMNLNKLLKSGELARVAHELSFADEDGLLAEIGYGKLPVNGVLRKLLPEDTDLEAKLAQDETTLQRIFNRAAKAFKDRGGIKVSGMEDVVFKFARCCEPLPGDPLIGYVTRGRGVTIHTRHCSQAMGFDPQRLINVSWDSAKGVTQRQVRITVIARDQVGILAQMSQSIAATGANIVTAQTTVTPDKKAISVFDITVDGASQVDAITRALEKIDAVMKVERRRFADTAGGDFDQSRS